MAAYSLAFIGHTNLLMGTMDGIYQYSADEERIKKISDVEKVVRLEVKKDRSVWAKTLYGEIYLREEGESSFVLQDRESEEVMTEYTDNDGCHWQTNLKGKEVLYYLSASPLPRTLPADLLPNRQNHGSDKLHEDRCGEQPE